MRPIIKDGHVAGMVARTLRGRLAKLAGSQPNELSELSLRLPDPATWGLTQLCDVAPDGSYAVLNDLLALCIQCAYELSEDVGAIYFTHSDEAKQSVGV